MKCVHPWMVMFAFGCGGDPVATDPVPTDPTTDAPTDEPIEAGPLTFEDTTPATGAVDAVFDFQVNGTVDGAAYRITLVKAENITFTGEGMGTFAPNNGVANAGLSEQVAQIYHVNGNNITPAKTFPGANDNPAAPSGLFPFNDMVTFGVIGVGGGTVHPVVYTNAGASTFLEIDGAGAPVETYVIGPAITIDAPPPPPVIIAPAGPTTAAVDEVVEYTLTGLNDAYYYRVTLVHGDYVTTDGNGGGTFQETPGAGTANAGPSQEVALITLVNGSVQEPGVKTYPAGTDDPAAPTGISPTAGTITVSITGVGSGTIYPVAYRNGGASTFLEIDANGAPTEDYGVGGSFMVP